MLDDYSFSTGVSNGFKVFLKFLFSTIKNSEFIVHDFYWRYLHIMHPSTQMLVNAVASSVPDSKFTSESILIQATMR